MAGLKERPRQVGGRCASCRDFAICGGNTRVRAQQLYGDPWAEDPGCYLSDAEIGCSTASVPPPVVKKRRIIPLEVQDV
jgi:hypothetical protein